MPGKISRGKDKKPGANRVPRNWVGTKTKLKKAGNAIRKKMVAPRASLELAYRAVISLMMLLVHKQRKIGKWIRNFIPNRQKNGVLHVIRIFRGTLKSIQNVLNPSIRKRTINVGFMVVFLLPLVVFGGILIDVTTRPPNANGLEFHSRHTVSFHSGDSSCHWDLHDDESCATTYEMDCPEIVKEGIMPSVPCYCHNLTDARIKIRQCHSTHHEGGRVRRSVTTSLHKSGYAMGARGKPWMEDHMSMENIFKIENWIFQNWTLALLVGYFLYSRTGSFAYMTVGLLVLSLMGTSLAMSEECSAVQNRDIINAGSSTWVDIVLEGQSCVTVAGIDKPTVSFMLKREDIVSPTLERIYGLEWSMENVKIATRCPTKGEAELVEEKQDSWTCTRTYSDRGWGSGCGLFAKGSMVACANIVAKNGSADEKYKELRVYSVDQSKVKYTVEIQSHTKHPGIVAYADAYKELAKGYTNMTEDEEKAITEQARAKVSRGIPATSVDFTAAASEQDVNLHESMGSVGLSCRPLETLDFANNYVTALLDGSSGFGHIVNKNWVNDIRLPWKFATGHYRNLETLVHWGHPRALSIDASMISDQTATISKALEGAYTIEHVGLGDTDSFYTRNGKLTCRIKLENLKIVGVSYPYCSPNLILAWAEEPKVTQHGTVAMRISIPTQTTIDLPCRLNPMVTELSEVAAKKVGILITTNPIAHATNEWADIEFQIPPGEWYIKIGMLKYPWTQKGSVVADGFEALWKGAHRAVISGPQHWDLGSVGGLWGSILKGTHTIFGAWFNLFFGGINKLALIGVGVLLIYIGMMMRNLEMTVIMCGVGALFIIFPLGVGAVSMPDVGMPSLPKGSMGCAIDYERGTLDCGIGEFVWNHQDDWLESFEYRLKDYDLAKEVTDKLADHNQMCLVCLDRVQCLMYKDHMGDIEDLLYQVYGHAQVEYNVKNMTFMPPVLIHENLKKNFSDITGGGAERENGIVYSAWLRTKRSIDFRSDSSGKSVYIINSGRYSFDECEIVTYHGLVFNQWQKLGISMTAIAQMSFTNIHSPYCQRVFSATVSKNFRTIHADHSRWIDSDTTKRVGNLTQASFNEINLCLWPDETTTDGNGVEMTKLFIPPAIAGPISHSNMIDGYQIQKKGPWHLSPLRIERGFCPDTVVHKTSNCDKPNASIRSTTKSNVIIREWCCRNCSMPPALYKYKDECWYAMDIRPVSMPIDAVRSPVLIPDVNRHGWTAGTTVSYGQIFGASAQSLN